MAVGSVSAAARRVSPSGIAQQPVRAHLQVAAEGAAEVQVVGGWPCRGTPTDGPAGRPGTRRSRAVGFRDHLGADRPAVDTAEPRPRRRCPPTRGRAPSRGGRILEDEVQVGAADPAVRHLDEHVGGADLGDGQVADLELPRAHVDRGGHGAGCHGGLIVGAGRAASRRARRELLRRAASPRRAPRPRRGPPGRRPAVRGRRRWRREPAPSLDRVGEVAGPAQRDDDRGGQQVLGVAAHDAEHRPARSSRSASVRGRRRLTAISVRISSTSSGRRPDREPDGDDPLVDGEAEPARAGAVEARQRRRDLAERGRPADEQRRGEDHDG